MKWHPGLRASITLTVVLVTLAAAATMALTTYHLQAGSSRGRFIEAAQTGFRSDAEQARRHRLAINSDPKTDGIANYMRGEQGITWAVLNFKPTNGPVSTSQNGMYTIVQGTGGSLPGQLPVSEVDRARRTLRPVIYMADTGLGPQLVIVGQTDPDLLLAEFYNTRPLDDELSTLRRQLGAVAAAVAVLGTVMGILAARRIQRRVRTAAVAARRFGHGALDTRLPVHGRDELAELAGSFNAMAQRLSESIDQLRVKDQQQRRFVADVAHDLRTPLASMIAATDSLHSPDDQDRSRSAELLATQVRRLSRLVEDLLEMSRFDAGVAEFRPELIDLNALVTDAVTLSAPDIEIHVSSTGDTIAYADPRRLHTVVRNLVTNALCHGGPPITVTLNGHEPHQVQVTVADSGPGVPAELTPFVFDRFARGDHARQHTEGSGLGLAIAHENAVLHGGRIEITNSHGAMFTLTVPRGSPTPAPPDRHGRG